MKRVTSIIIAIALCLSVMAGMLTASAAMYSDLPEKDNWAFAPISFVIGGGIMGSTSREALTFEPNTTTTRSMVVSILYRLAGSPETAFEARFPDVEADAWYAGAVLWAARKGIVTGYDNGLFGPEDTVTREQIAVILKGYGETVEQRDCTQQAALYGFADAACVTWSETAVRWAVAEGLISGKTDGTALLLDPQGSATRAEVAAVMMRAVSMFDGEDVPTCLTQISEDSPYIYAYTGDKTQIGIPGLDFTLTLPENWADRVEVYLQTPVNGPFYDTLIVSNKALAESYAEYFPGENNDLIAKTTDGILRVHWVPEGTWDFSEAFAQGWCTDLEVHNGYQFVLFATEQRLPDDDNDALLRDMLIEKIGQEAYEALVGDLRCTSDEAKAMIRFPDPA